MLEILRRVFLMPSSIINDNNPIAEIICHFGLSFLEESIRTNPWLFIGMFVIVTIRVTTSLDILSVSNFGQILIDHIDHEVCLSRFSAIFRLLLIRKRCKRRD
jgi:hypothetical protein